MRKLRLIYPQIYEACIWCGEKIEYEKDDWIFRTPDGKKIHIECWVDSLCRRKGLEN